MKKVCWLIPHIPSIVTSRTGHPPQLKAGWIEASLKLLQNLPYEFHIFCFGSFAFDEFRVGNILYRSHPSWCNISTSNRYLPYYIQRKSNVTKYGLFWRKFAEEERFDLIHVHGSESTLGLVAEYATCPVILSIQGLKTAIQAKYLGTLKRRSLINRTQLLRATIDLVHGYGSFWGECYARQDSVLENRIIQNCDAFLGKTPFDEAMIRAIKKNPVYYRHGIHVRRPTTNETWNTKYDRSAYRIVNVAIGRPYKDHKTLVTAAGIVADILNQSVELVMIGAIPQSIISILHKIASRSNNKVLLKMTGSLAASRIDQEILLADIYVSPSFIENECHSLLEAMQLGCPCITTPVGGIKSYIREGVNALLFDPGNEFELAGQMVRLLGDSNLQKNIGSSAKKTVAGLSYPSLVSVITQAYESAWRGEWREE